MKGKRLSGEIEIDEAYFGGRRKGKRGRAAAGKSVVLGLLKRYGKVHPLTAENLMDIIKKRTRKGSIYHTDTFKSYNSLLFVGEI